MTIFLRLFYSILFLSYSLTAAERLPVGEIYFSKGEVKVLTNNGKTHSVNGSTLLFLGDRIKTGEKSRVFFQFLDGTRISLSSNADYRIRAYSNNRHTGMNSHSTILNGAFQFLVGEIAKIAPQNFKIQTPTAVIGVRGSGGHAWVSNGTRGSPAQLKIAPIKGHKLFITTVSGLTTLLDDPSVGASINASGEISSFKVQNSLFLHPTPPETLNISFPQNQTTQNSPTDLQNYIFPYVTTGENTAYPFTLIFPFDIPRGTRASAKKKRKKRPAQEALTNELESNMRSLDSIGTKEQSQQQETLRLWPTILGLFDKAKYLIGGGFSKK